jgi:hypothetical protein
MSFLVFHVLLLLLMLSSYLCSLILACVFMLLMLFFYCLCFVLHIFFLLLILLLLFTFFYPISHFSIHVLLLLFTFVYYFWSICFIARCFPSTTCTFLLLIKLSFHVLLVLCPFLPLICTCVGWFKIQNLEFYAPNWF